MPEYTTRYEARVVAAAARHYIDRAPGERGVDPALLRRLTTSRLGGAPKSRAYSRLNCDGLS